MNWTYSYIDDNESRCGYLIRKSTTNRPIAFVASANRSDEQEQIARLIATAPKLLVALRTLLHNVEHGNGASAWSDSKEKAREALACAEVQ